MGHGLLYDRQTCFWTPSLQLLHLRPTRLNDLTQLEILRNIGLILSQSTQMLLMRSQSWNTKLDGVFAGPVSSSNSHIPLEVLRIVWLNSWHYSRGIMEINCKILSNKLLYIINLNLAMKSWILWRIKKTSTNVCRRLRRCPFLKVYFNLKIWLQICWSINSSSYS